MLFNESGVFEEDWDWLRTFWDNYHLRGSVIQGSMWTDGSHYKQPDTNLPFGRGFIIGPDGRVEVPYFGHRPSFVIETIRELLETTGVPETQSVETVVTLSAGRPNPFSGTTTLSLSLPAAGHTLVSVHDVAGRRVAGLLDRPLAAGRHQVSWDGRNSEGVPTASGVYFVRAATTRGTTARRLLRLR